MGDTSGNTDSKDAEIGFFFHKCHDRQTQGGTCQTVEDAEQVTEHESYNENSDDGNKRGFFPAICFKNKEYRQVGKTELDTGDSGKKGNQRFHIAKDDRHGGEQSEIRNFFLVHTYYVAASKSAELSLESAAFSPSITTLFGRQTMVPPALVMAFCFIHR